VLIRILLLVALLAAPGFRPAFSHEGHSHGDEPAPPTAAAPRAEAHSELFEMNRSGFVGGSNFQIGWSPYEQDDEQILP
jgi:hypothetical protein